MIYIFFSYQYLTFENTLLPKYLKYFGAKHILSEVPRRCAECQATNLITSSAACNPADSTVQHFSFLEKIPLSSSNHFFAFLTQVTPAHWQNWDFGASQNFAEISNFAVIDDHLCGWDRTEVGQTDGDVEKKVMAKLMTNTLMANLFEIHTRDFWQIHLQSDWWADAARQEHFFPHLNLGAHNHIFLKEKYK